MRWEGTAFSRAGRVSWILTARLEVVLSRPRQDRAAKCVSASRQILHGLKAVQDDALYKRRSKGGGFKLRHRRINEPVEPVSAGHYDSKQQHSSSAKIRPL